MRPAQKHIERSKFIIYCVIYEEVKKFYQNYPLKKCVIGYSCQCREIYAMHTGDCAVEFTPHRAADDAYATMRITEALCKKHGCGFEELKKLCN